MEMGLQSAFHFIPFKATIGLALSFNDFELTDLEVCPARRLYEYTLIRGMLRFSIPLNIDPPFLPFYSCTPKFNPPRKCLLQ